MMPSERSQDGLAAPSSAPAPSRLVKRRTRAGRTHGLTRLRRMMTELRTKRFDQRSAVAARRFTVELTAVLGGYPSRAQATLIELGAWNRITDTEPR